MKRLQFSLATALFAITAVSVFCAIVRLEPGFHYSILWPAMLLTVAYWFARSRDQPEWAWSFIAGAWMTALYYFVNDVVLSFSYRSVHYEVNVSDDLRFVSITYFSNAGIPLFLTLPAIWQVSKSSRKRPTRGLKWIKWCVIAVVIDLHVLAVSLAIILATRPSR